jgi:hypothetical protein
MFELLYWIGIGIGIGMDDLFLFIFYGRILMIK